MDRHQITESAKVLRDFFSATNAEQLESSTTNLSRQFAMSMETATDWTEVEYDFNRLFVGPAAVPAPPYASAYQKEPTLMGTKTLEVRQAYARMGLAVPDMGTTPDDHLAFELDAILALNSQTTPEDAEALVALREWFITEHMGEWIPQFTAAVEQQENVSKPVQMATNALKLWIGCAMNDVCEQADRK